MLRPELEQLPERLKRLPVHRGYPVPWFVEWIEDGEAVPIGAGEPDFRVMSRARLYRAIDKQLCWICGDRLGAFKSFVVGPMCVVNRTSAEPPSHRDCAEWAARNCPFLARPHARRRDAGKVADTKPAPGIALDRNPGVAVVWTTKRYRLRPLDDGVLFNIGDPASITWWAEGRRATREEITASIDSGLPALLEVAEEEGRQAVRELERYVKAARKLVRA